MLQRLIANWVYGGALAGVLLFLLSPILLHGWPPALAVTFLCLPVYMLHQYEEHDKDRFRTFLNQRVGHGKELLTPAAVFIINIPGVWGVIALALWLAVTFNLGFGLIALYLIAVNAVGHIVAALIFRAYNPGLVTAIVLFLPISIYGIRILQAAGCGSLAMQLTGLLSGIGIHIALIAYALVRSRTL